MPSVVPVEGQQHAVCGACTVAVACSLWCLLGCTGVQSVVPVGVQRYLLRCSGVQTRMQWDAVAYSGACWGAVAPVGVQQRAVAPVGCSGVQWPLLGCNGVQWCLLRWRGVDSDAYPRELCPQAVYQRWPQHMQRLLHMA